MRRSLKSLFAGALFCTAVFFGSAFGADNAAGPKELEPVLRDLESYAQQAMKDWNVPGMAIAIVRGDEVVYQKAFGVKKVRENDPVTVDTIFQIGSASKAFTSTLVAMMVDEKKFDWNDKVVDRLVDFRMYDPWVTSESRLFDIMAQHSGMPAHAADGAVMVGYDRRHIVSILRFIKPVTSFRSAFAYQNNLFLVAAELIEKYSGKSWEENVAGRIFEPLGMAASSATLESYRNSKDVATLHHLVNDEIVALPMDWPYIDWVYVYGPAGGINSNVIDMTKWLRLHCASGLFEDKRLVSEDNMKYVHSPKTITPKVPNQPNQHYCEGWVYREACPYPIIWHNGGTSGSKTMVAFVPEAKLGIVILSNLDENKMVEAVAFRFFDLYFGNPLKDWSRIELDAFKKAEEEEKAKFPKEPLAPTPSLPLDQYAGEYKNDIYGIIDIARDGDGLIATIGPKRVKIWLRHWDRNIFKASWDMYIEKEDIGFATFEVGADNMPSKVAFDEMNEDGCGTFERIADTK